MLTYAELRAFGQESEEGDYLAYYEDTDDSDVGSRCGYSDPDLDMVKRLLFERGLTLTADDEGLMVEVVVGAEDL